MLPVCFWKTLPACYSEGPLFQRVRVSRGLVGLRFRLTFSRVRVILGTGLSEYRPFGIADCNLGRHGVNPESYAC